jgi:HK97 family phage major capsid protein
MKLSAQLRQKFAALRTKAQALLAAADKNTGALSAEQQTEFDGLKSQMDTLEASIKRAEDMEAAERFAPAVESRPADGSRVTSVSEGFEQDRTNRGFRSPRQLLTAVHEAAGVRNIAQITNPALRSLAIEGDAGVEGFALPFAFVPEGMRGAVGSDEQNTSQDRFGGFAVRETLLPSMLQVGAEADPTEGRVQNVPMESPTVKIIARTDKDHTTSVSGGLSVGRRSELAAFAATRASMERVTLTAAMLAGISYESEELISDSMLSFIAIISAGFKAEFPHRKLQEKLRGTGGDQYLGILSALASAGNGPTISIAKESGQAAGTILAQNILKMRARCWGFADAIWLSNHATYPQLRTMVLPAGVGGQLMYQPTLIDGRPDTLEGRPIFYSEYPSALGTQGDLMLVNMTQYLEGIYQPMEFASSVHVRFETHEQTFKFWERNAGAPWWRAPLTPHKGADTLSPFVVLDNR